LKGFENTSKHRPGDDLVIETFPEVIAVNMTERRHTKEDDNR
jgi:hypothetical protein